MENYEERTLNSLNSYMWDSGRETRILRRKEFDKNSYITFQWVNGIRTGYVNVYPQRTEIQEHYGRDLVPALTVHH